MLLQRDPLRAQAALLVPRLPTRACHRAPLAPQENIAHPLVLPAAPLVSEGLILVRRALHPLQSVRTALQIIILEALPPLAPLVPPVNRRRQERLRVLATQQAAVLGSI